MADEIELVGDSDGVVVVGPRAAVDRFLDHAGLTAVGRQVGVAKVSALLGSGAEIAKTASMVAEQSAYYLKLTPESAKRLQDAGGLMKTKTKGISHAMLGDPGKVNKWLQVEDGGAALLTNPAVLSGVGGLLTQFAQQGEAQQLRALLVRIDEKLDDLQRRHRDGLLAQLSRAASAIDEATILHEHGGDPTTSWAKVSGEVNTVREVQEAALSELGALADKVNAKSTTGELRKVAQQIEREVAIQLAILARCFELQDEFRVVELDHVLATAPETIDGHRRGLVESRERRREAVLAKTGRIMERLDAASEIASANIILHARAARSIVSSLNATAQVVGEFHAPLGLATGRSPLSTPPWRAAIRDPQQLRRAGAEAGQKVAMAGGTAIALAAAARTLPKRGL